MLKPSGLGCALAVMACISSSSVPRTTSDVCASIESGHMIHLDVLDIDKPELEQVIDVYRMRIQRVFDVANTRLAEEEPVEEVTKTVDQVTTQVYGKFMEDVLYASNHDARVQCRKDGNIPPNVTFSYRVSETIGQHGFHLDQTRMKQDVCHQGQRAEYTMNEIHKIHQAGMVECGGDACAYTESLTPATTPVPVQSYVQNTIQQVLAWDWLDVTKETTSVELQVIKPVVSSSDNVLGGAVLYEQNFIGPSRIEKIIMKHRPDNFTTKRFVTHEMTHVLTMSSDTLLPKKYQVQFSEAQAMLMELEQAELSELPRLIWMNMWHYDDSIYGFGSTLYTELLREVLDLAYQSGNLPNSLQSYTSKPERHVMESITEDILGGQRRMSIKEDIEKILSQYLTREMVKTARERAYLRLKEAIINPDSMSLAQTGTTQKQKQQPYCSTTAVHKFSLREES